MSQSTPIRDLPKDNLRNPDEARIVQSIINDNVEEYNQQYSQQQMPPQYMNDMDSAVDVMPDFQQPRMPPGMMGGAHPMMNQPMPQHISQIPYEQQQQMEAQQRYQQQMHMQQQQAKAAAMSAATDVGVPKELLNNSSMMSWLMKEAKLPLIVSAVYFFTSMNFIKMLFANYIPYMSISFLNLLFRAILTGILVYVVKKFV